MSSKNIFCQGCGSDSSYHIEDESTADVICKKCGIVVGQVFSAEREWGEYDPNENDGDNGCYPNKRADVGDIEFNFLGTDQGYAAAKHLLRSKKYFKDTDRDPYDDTNNNNNDLCALDKMMKETQENNENIVAYGSFETREQLKRHEIKVEMLKTASEIGILLNTSKLLINRAKEYLKRWAKTQTIPKKSIWTSRELILAAFLKASQIEHGTLTLNMVTSQFDSLDVKKIKHYWKFFIHHLPNHAPQKSVTKSTLELVENYLAQILDSKDLNSKSFYSLLNKASKLLDQLNTYLEGKQPSTVAVICIFILCNLLKVNYNFQELCKISGSKESSIRTILKQSNDWKINFPEILK